MSDDKNMFDGFSKKEENYSCDSCEFTNQSIKGIRTHVTRQHREKDSKKRGRPEDKDEQVDVKKSKHDDLLEDAQLLEDIESQSLESLMAKARTFEFEDVEDEESDNKVEEEETMLPFSLSEKYEEESQNLLIDLKTDEERFSDQINDLKRKTVELEAEIIKRDITIEQKEKEIYNTSSTLAMFKQEVETKNEEVVKKNETIEVILSEKNLLEEEITDKNKKLNDVEECIKLYGKKLEVMKKKSSKLEEENKSLRKRVSDLEASTPANKGVKKQVEDLQESVSKLTSSNRELQIKLTESLNRNAQLETMNARTMLQNKNLSEIANKTSVKVPEAMEVDGESKSKEAHSTTKAKVEERKQKKKKQCRYFQRGNCTRRDCQFSHPADVCKVFSRLGEEECPDENFCDKSHPVQRRGSQSQVSFPGQNLQNDYKLNYVQQQHGYQEQPYVQQHAP